MRSSFVPMDEAGVDFECVSPGEVEWLEETLPDFDLARVLFTPNFARREEYAWGLERGLQVTLDNLYPLQAWPELFAGAKLFVRIDPGQGRGHHEHVKTAGVHSKFGVPRFEVAELKRLVKEAGAEIIGIHAHSGSGILDPNNWRTVAGELVQIAEQFPGVTTIDLGGGLGVPEKPGDKPIDLDTVDATLAEIRETYPQYKLWPRTRTLRGRASRRAANARDADEGQGRDALYRCWYRHEFTDSSGSVWRVSRDSEPDSRR